MTLPPLRTWLPLVAAALVIAVAVYGVTVGDGRSAHDQQALAPAGSEGKERTESAAERERRLDAVARRVEMRPPEAGGGRPDDDDWVEVEIRRVPIGR